MSKSTVYFTNELTPEAVVKMYKQLGVELPGKVAVKVHSGEDGNQNYLHPEFMKPVIDAMHGTVVECNTAYGGARNETPKHIELMKKHRWSDLFDVDIMDAEGPDVEWPVENGKVLKVNYLGKNIENYDSMLVLIHFKGHPMGGYGGALKQLSIGCASSAGKAYIHSGGKVTDQNVLWENCAPQDTFLEAMADAASTVAKHFAGKIAYVAVMKNLSVDCDCCAVAEDPCMDDVGILSSLDPVALDRACVDLVMNSNDPGRDHFMERVNSRHGTHTIDAAAELGHWQQRVRSGARVTPLPHKTMHPPTHCAGGFLRLCFVCLQSGLATVIKRFYVIFLVEYPGKTALVHVPALAGVHGHLRRVHRVLPAILPLGRRGQPADANRRGHFAGDGVLWHDMADVHGIPVVHVDEGITAGCHQRAVQQQRCGGRRLQRQVRRRQRESGRPAAAGHQQSAGTGLYHGHRL